VWFRVSRNGQCVHLEYIEAVEDGTQTDRHASADKSSDGEANARRFEADIGHILKCV